MEINKNHPLVAEILRHTFPGHRGRKPVKVYAREKKHISDYWDEGSRTYTVCFDMKSNQPVSKTAAGFVRQEQGNPFHQDMGELPVTPELAVVEDHIFRGKSVGLSISIHPETFSEWEAKLK